MDSSHIRYVKHDKLNTIKWDNCISQAGNGLIYAYSWYLDRVCPEWDALVLGDYKYVLPLTFKVKWGVKYLYQPTYCQQLGIFPVASPQLIQFFTEEIQNYFRFAEINFNAYCNTSEVEKGFYEKANLVLDLSSDYSDIKEGFSSHTKRHLKKAQKNKLNLAIGASVDEYIRFKIENRPNNVFPKTKESLKQLLSYSLVRGMSKIYGVYDADNQLCAAAIFMFSSKRITYLNAVSSENGRELGAMYYLVDSFLKGHAKNNLLLDFEGSMLPGIARFYKGFGATIEMYYHYHYNHLPIPLRWIKQ